jgi:23S rRNA (uracil1939-C5)-methyltransferase
MHLDEPSQLDALRAGVSDVLGRVGHVDVPVSPVFAGARRVGYRNRVTFTLRRRAGRVFAGYHAMSGRRLVDVEICPLAEPAVARAWRDLRNGWGGGARHLPPGGDLRLTLRASASGEVGLLVAGGRASDRNGGGFAAGVEALAAATTGLTSYWWLPSDGPRQHLFGAEKLRDSWHGIELRLLPEAFLQVNREVAEAIERHLDEGLGPVTDRRLLDLYAGVGLRALRWSAAGAHVRAVESNADAVETGSAVARGTGNAVDFVQSTVESALSDPAPVDVVVVNPPRAGLSDIVIGGLRRIAAGRLVYVSCDPGTLARDVDRLSGVWTPSRAHPFDAFPHTGHVETVLWFERAERAAA